MDTERTGSVRERDETAHAAKQAKDAQVAAKATEDAEKAARAAQEAQVAKAANPPKVTPGPAKASSGKAATPVQQFQVDDSLSPENDDFEKDTPGPKLNPHTVRYPSHTPTSRARGRPRKSLQPPTMDDKPIGATKEELLCWQKSLMLQLGGTKFLVLMWPKVTGKLKTKELKGG